MPPPYPDQLPTPTFKPTYGDLYKLFVLQDAEGNDLASGGSFALAKAYLIAKSGSYPDEYRSFAINGANIQPTSFDASTMQNGRLELTPADPSLGEWALKGLSGTTIGGPVPPVVTKGNEDDSRRLEEAA